ncbi:MAG: methionine--tRNA ligase [Candidatus Doudnabacteria bacterium]|nr:methionine--tRNA ligase [Candidatus Doudnabacteria bacterium]
MAISKTKKKFYITTSIPYVNAHPHVGFALELIQADALARFHRLLSADTFFLTGTDEHGSKVPKAAQAAGKEILDFVNEISARFKKLCAVLGISNSHFIRTTDQGHKKSAQKFWKKTLDSGDIYKSKYEGLYCVGCENYYNESDLEGGLCPIHKTKPETLSEENYFFRFSKYQAQLLDHFQKNPGFVVPKTRYNEIFEFIKHGLSDISISRSTKTLKWGVPVPGDREQVIYIWFDALINYLSGIGYAEEDATFKKYWPADVHLIGKDILRFHAGLWPAMLLSAGLPLPKQIFVHGFISVDGQKISKSMGNIIDPFALAEKYGADVLRYFLLREIPSDGDGDFSVQKLEARYTADLVNNLGNLVSRLTNLIEKELNGVVPFDVEAPKKAENLEKYIRDFRLHEALAEIWENLSWANQYIDEVKLWELPQKNPKLFKEAISSLVALLRQVISELSPFLPHTAQRLEEIFSAEKIVKSPPLFPRLVDS